MKLLKNSVDFLILDDNNKVIQVVKAEEVGDAQKLLKEQKEESYRKKVQDFDNNHLIEGFVEMIYAMAFGQDKNNPDFGVVFNCVYGEILRRMK